MNHDIKAASSIATGAPSSQSCADGPSRKNSNKRMSKSAIKRQKRKEAYIKRLLAMTPTERAAFLQRIGGKIPRGMEVDFGEASGKGQYLQNVRKKRIRKHKNPHSNQERGFIQIRRRLIFHI